MPVVPFGYAVSESEQRLLHLMEDPKALLIDIRFVPVSRWRPAWRKSALAAQFGLRYLHMRGLGNVNYKQREKGIQLYAPDEPLTQLRQLMGRGATLVLLCACQDYEQCHRRMVYELLQEGEV